MSWERERQLALDAVRVMLRLIEDTESSEVRTTAGYLDAKRTLAKAFQTRALEKYGASQVLDETVALVEGGIREAFPQLPPRYARVQGYGAVHVSLLGYLADRVGEDVSAEELRILTCDAVHTERRVRDLRDLGFTLSFGKAGGSQVYRLQDRVPDVLEGARLNVAKNIRNDKTMTSDQRAELLARFCLERVGD